MATLSKKRRDTNESQYSGPSSKLLRFVASGTLFNTYTLSLPYQPEPSTAVRAHSVLKARGGSATILVSLLAQFQTVESLLVAPLGGNEEGQTLIRDLEQEGIITRHCKVWKDFGVPTAWILHAGASLAFEP